MIPLSFSLSLSARASVLPVVDEIEEKLIYFLLSVTIFIGGRSETAFIVFYYVPF